MPVIYPYIQYSGTWNLTSQGKAKAAGTWPVLPVPSQQAYTTAGTYSWVAPASVTSVSVVCVGAGGTGGPISGDSSGGGGGDSEGHSCTS